MKLSRRYALLAALLGVAAAALPAIASSETTPTVEAVNTTGSGIYSEEHHSWSPSQVSVMANGAVTFRNSTEVPHGIEWRSSLKPTCEEGTGKVPVGTSPAASGTKWSGTCTFSQAGTYTFYCTVHGPEMTGTVTVSANGTTVTTQTTPTAPAPPTPPPTEPSGSPLGALSLHASQHGTSVRGSLEVLQTGVGGHLEIDLLASSASLSKGGHSRRVRVGRLVRGSLAAGKLSFAVPLNSKAKRALEHHHRLALTVSITLAPSSGKATTLIRTVVEHR